MKRLSIKARVTIWYTLLVALIAFLAALVLFLSARRMMHNYYLETLTGTAQLALDDIRMEDGELEIDRDLDELPSVRVALFTTSGELIYGRVRFDLPFVEGEMRTATERSGGEWYVLDTRMEFDGAEEIWLRCYISADAAANLGALSMELAALILPMLVVLAGVGGYFIARRAFRPVTRITRTAESIIDGADLQKRIALEGTRDELYRLAKVFDDMLDRLERSFERERRFTSDASHELRTPVAAILAQTDFALSELATPEDRMEALRDIRLRAGQMSTLINRLLALTRMDAGQTRVELERIDLCDLAEVVAAQIEDGAAERGMTVALSLDGPVWARCDQTMLTQALLNLAENAVKYGREDGHVRVVAFARDGEARLAVEDDGPGISPEAMPHIFERFYQGDRSRQAGGAGLGLSLVRLIARLHGGRVEVESTLGQGSRFTIALPLEGGETENVGGG